MHHIHHNIASNVTSPFSLCLPPTGGPQPQHSSDDSFTQVTPPAPTTRSVTQQDARACINPTAAAEVCLSAPAERCVCVHAIAKSRFQFIEPFSVYRAVFCLLYTHAPHHRAQQAWLLCLVATSSEATCQHFRRLDSAKRPHPRHCQHWAPPRPHTLWPGPAFQIQSH